MKITFEELFSKDSSPVPSISPPDQGEEKNRSKESDFQQAFKDDLEKDFWLNSLCFDCLHWWEKYRFCRWNCGGYLISWGKCRGRAYTKP